MATIDLPLSLHDGRLAGYATEADDVVLSVVKWDETPLTLRCCEVVFFRQQVGDGDLEDLIECDEGELLQETKKQLARLTYAASEVAQYRHFRLRDNSHIPVVDVVCKNLIQ
jgi:hypothetical protein